MEVPRSFYPNWWMPSARATLSSAQVPPTPWRTWAPKRDAVPALTAALADSDRYVRISAATTLGEVGSDAAAAMPSLFRLVISEDTDAQTHFVDAVVAICQYSTPAVQMLQELLGASGDQVRGSAARARGEPHGSTERRGVAWVFFLP